MRGRTPGARRDRHRDTARPGYGPRGAARPRGRRRRRWSSKPCACPLRGPRSRSRNRARGSRRRTTSFPRPDCAKASSIARARRAWVRMAAGMPSCSALQKSVAVTSPGSAWRIVRVPGARVCSRSSLMSTNPPQRSARPVTAPTHMASTTKPDGTAQHDRGARGRRSACGDETTGDGERKNRHQPEVRERTRTEPAVRELVQSSVGGRATSPPPHPRPAASRRGGARRRRCRP